jgi:hypothetical protein
MTTPPTRPDYDSPWKNALEWHFQPFLNLCFPTIHNAINWNRPHTFLDKELQKIVRDANTTKRYADKLAKVYLHNGQETWILIYIEVQGSKETTFPQRMYSYNHRIQDRYNHPVESLAILADTNPTWRPNHHTQRTIQTEINFHYPIIKLLDYNQHWDQLHNSHNPFATVIMAHLKAQQTQKSPHDRQAWKFTLTRNLYDQGHDKQTILNLYHFIDWVMTLPPDLEQQYLTDITHYEETLTMPYITNAERRGIEKGIEKGIELEREESRKQQTLNALNTLTKVLTRRNPKLPKTLTTTLQKLTLEQLDRLLDIALDTDTLKDFTTQMKTLISQP